MWPALLTQTRANATSARFARVEQQLDRHQHDQRVAPRDHADDADEEQDRGERDVVLRSVTIIGRSRSRFTIDSRSIARCGLRAAAPAGPSSPASSTTPITATIRMNAVTSNGSRLRGEQRGAEVGDAAERVRVAGRARRSRRAARSRPACGRAVTVDDGQRERGEHDRRIRARAASRSGPDARTGATPLESSAMTNTNRIRIAPL